jgi:type IV secretion system protein VirB3
VLERIWKGATRPAMKWGVPLLAIPLLFMPAVLGGVWVSLGLAIFVSRTLAVVFAALVLLCVLGTYLWMRYVTHKDDQRLRQLMMRIRLDFRLRSRRLWGARTYSGITYNGPRDVRTQK